MTETTTMEYTLRELEAADMFTVSTILSKIGIRKIQDCFNTPEITNAIANKSTANLAEVVGINVAFDIAGIILENLESCKDDIFKLLGRLTGTDKAKIAKLPPADFMELIIEVVRKKEFRDFILVVSKLFK